MDANTKYEPSSNISPLSLGQVCVADGCQQQICTKQLTIKPKPICGADECQH
jgi:hypothetical protein